MKTVMNFFQNCCICLSNALNLVRCKKSDKNKVKLVDKLKLCVPEINWLDNFQICNECNDILAVVLSFRETCLKSNDIRKQHEEKQKNNFKFIKSENPENVDIIDNSLSPKNEDYQDLTDTEIDEEAPIKKRNRKSWKFKCEHCEDVFNTSTKLISHAKSEHSIESKDMKPYSCSICDSKFGNSSYLAKHLKYHEGNRTHVCTFCGKGFITKTDLNVHEKQHLNKREYKCGECSKRYNTRKDLRSHNLVVHTDPSTWVHVCKICSKPFPIKSNYDSHMRRHTGDKKFSCHLCEKKFTDKCVLQKHLKSHSNVREYKCVQCKKEYKDKRVMEIHMAKMHGIGNVKVPVREKKFYCHVCPKSYFAKNKLTMHLYSHSGERPFFCNICEKKFSNKSYVKQHMKNIHNVIEECDK